MSSLILLCLHRKLDMTIVRLASMFVLAAVDTVVSAWGADKLLSECDGDEDPRCPN